MAAAAYDLIVVGGGSGGLACSKAAAELGARVAVLDFVKPSPAGTKWSLGGTCVNVGCIPKKLMHTAGIHGEAAAMSQRFGWNMSAEGHDWSTMVTQVNNYIKSLNFAYKNDLKSKKVQYINAFGKFRDANTIECTDKKGEVSEITASNIVIAVGGRPTPLNCEGSEHVIDSDDIFWKKSSPGKTCVIGASYVALECAGFLNALGLDTTVAVRSRLLRGFDTEYADKIGAHMEAHGTTFRKGFTPASITQDEASGKLTVAFQSSASKDAPLETEEFDTVLAAIGRRPCTAELGLEAAGVEVQENGKIRTNFEQTNVPNIYAIGDVIDGAPELTPVAIKAGKLLASRLFGNGVKVMDYHTIPTTVFTPLEYGCIGFSEEDAINEFGADNIEVYHTSFEPLEWALNPTTFDNASPEYIKKEFDRNACGAKLICNKAEDEHVVGLHYLGPNAGEVTQGFAVAMRLGATKEDFDLSVGIHPTTAEWFTTLNVTKSSGEEADAGGC
jgi:thioredoxin reductase (NADPH)